VGRIVKRGLFAGPSPSSKQNAPQRRRKEGKEGKEGKEKRMKKNENNKNEIDKQQQ
jgi:hypothetical protein